MLMFDLVVSVVCIGVCTGLTVQRSIMRCLLLRVGPVGQEAIEAHVLHGHMVSWPSCLISDYFISKNLHRSRGNETLVNNTS